MDSDSDNDLLDKVDEAPQWMVDAVTEHNSLSAIFERIEKGDLTPEEYSRRMREQKKQWVDQQRQIIEKDARLVLLLSGATRTANLILDDIGLTAAPDEAEHRETLRQSAKKLKHLCQQYNGQ